MTESQSHTLPRHRKKRIVTVGSGTVEYVLKYSGEKIELGSKHATELTLLYGGSGVNYAMRLLTAGDDALPILAIGHDELGQKIQQALLSVCEQAADLPTVERFIRGTEPAAFFDPNIKTSSTVILVQGTQRTIFTQTLQNGEHFIGTLERRIKDVFQSLEDHPDA